MQIKPKLDSHIHSEIASAAQAAKVDHSNASSARPSQPLIPRSDEVHISAAGRELAASRGRKTELTPERTAELRKRVLDGAYNSLAVVDKVARRIIGSGDLG